jgi:hypothetical protein
VASGVFWAVSCASGRSERIGTTRMVDWAFITALSLEPVSMSPFGRYNFGFFGNEWNVRLRLNCTTDLPLASQPEYREEFTPVSPSRIPRSHTAIPSQTPYLPNPNPHLKRVRGGPPHQIIRSLVRSHLKHRTFTKHSHPSMLASEPKRQLMAPSRPGGVVTSSPPLLATYASRPSRF